MKKYETPVVEVKGFSIENTVMLDDDSSIIWGPPVEY